jgi:hypothetical protein
MSTQQAAMAEMAARTAQQSTQVLCETLMILVTMPRTPETNLVRTDIIETLCARHPEVEDAAEAWAFGDDQRDYEAVVIDAALAAIGA